jgi:hypothetical protein
MKLYLTYLSNSFLIIDNASYNIQVSLAPTFAFENV